MYKYCSNVVQCKGQQAGREPRLREGVRACMARVWAGLLCVFCCVCFAVLAACGRVFLLII